MEKLKMGSSKDIHRMQLKADFPHFNEYRRDRYGIMGMVLALSAGGP